MAKEKNYSVILFVLSLFLTLIIAFFVFLLTYKPNNTAVGTDAPYAYAPATVLFCDTDNNNAYILCLNFNNGEITVERLYIDVSVYRYGGKSELLKNAQKLKPDVTRVIAVTETQLCALIDYFGGYPTYVSEHLSQVCGGISKGQQNIVGVSAINIFKKEKHNRLMALNIVEWLSNKWCCGMREKYVFFKLLNLSDTDISYTDYYKRADMFKNFVDKAE